MSIENKKRLLSFDPNDNSDISNVSYNMEDLQFSVDLNVVLPKRYDCGQEKIEEIITNINANSNWRSFLCGEKLKKDDNSSFLTTSYTNISYQEFSSRGHGNKESLGINSIDINFDSHFYPIVTIKFSDVRASALFSPEEAVATYNQEQAKGKDGKQAYGSFFRSLFKYPYPLFLLKVKGFYGDRVTFKLAVSDFKSSFNPSKGNFDVTVTFLGYMYGLYTDLPMNLVMVAPYYDYNLWKSKDYRFIEDGGDGSQICTFVEFIENYNQALIDFSEEDLQDNTSYQNYKKLIAKRNSIDDLIKSKSEFYTSFINEAETNQKKESSKYIILLPKNNSSARLKFNDSSNTKKKADIYKEKIKEYNYEYESNIEDKFLTDFIKNNYCLDTKDTLKGIPSNYWSQPIESFDSTKEEEPKEEISYVLAPNTVDTLNQDLFEKLEADEELKIGLTSYIKAKNVSSTYIFLIKKTPDIDNILDTEFEQVKEQITNEQNNYDRDIALVFSKKLGFTMNIENVYRMIFAHISFFIEIFNNGVLKRIYESRTQQDRSCGNMGINSENSDLPKEYFSKNKDSFVPPFFAYFEKDRNKRVLKYPGQSNTVNISKCQEVKFVEQFCESVESAGESLVQALTTLEDNIEIIENNNNIDPNAVLHFTPTIMSDIYFYGTNPYSYYADILKKDNEKIDAEHLLYLLYYRYITKLLINQDGLFNKEEFKKFFNNELENLKSSNFILSKEEKNRFISYKDNGYNSLQSVLQKNKTTFFQLGLRNETRDDFYIFKENPFNVSEVSNNDILYRDRYDENIFINDITPYQLDFYSKCIFQDDPDMKECKKVYTNYGSIFNFPGKSNFTENSCLYKLVTDENNNISEWKVDNEYLVGYNEDDADLFLNNYDSNKNELFEYYFPTIIYKNYVGCYLQNMFLTCKKGNEITYAQQVAYECKDIDNVNTIIGKETDNKLKALIFLAGMFMAYLDKNFFIKHIRTKYFIFWPKMLILYYGALVYYNNKRYYYSIVSSRTGYFFENNYRENYNDGVRDYLNELKDLNDSIKETLKNYFIKWVESDFITNILPVLSKIPAKDDVYCLEDKNFLSSSTYIVYWKHETEQDKLLKKLYGERVCIYNFGVEKFNSFKDSDFTNGVNLFVNSFSDDIKEENKQEKNSSTSDDKKSDVSQDNKYACYYMLKNLYDRWLCSINYEQFSISSPQEYNNKKEFLLKGSKRDDVVINEFDSFLFIDSLYNDIGKDFMVNPDIVIDMIKSYMSYNAKTSRSVYQFMRDLAEKNNLLFIELPVFNNYSNYDSIMNIFKPNFQYSNKENMQHTTGSHLIVYTGEVSHTISDEDYQGDELIDLTESDFYDSNNTNTSLPAFAVTFAKQNQMFFKNININMDTPKVTAESTANLLRISQGGGKGDLSFPYGIGSDLFNIYSNRSYTCTVEMLGCVNIMPMMYFKLNNIPMFRGYYMIINVSHSIVPGNITTKFTGVRISKNSIQRPTLIFNIQTLKQKLKINTEGIIANRDVKSYSIEGTKIIESIDNPDVKIELDSLIGSKYKWANNKIPFYRNERLEDPTFIVLHYTAGLHDDDSYVRGVGKDWNNNNLAHASADYCVGKTLIVQYNPNPAEYQSWANATTIKNLNKTINLSRTQGFGRPGRYVAIEMSSLNKTGKVQDPNSDGWYFSNEVLNNTLSLCEKLIKKYNMDKGKIKENSYKGIIWTHYMSSDKNKLCPGIKGWNENEDKLNDFRKRLYNLVTDTDGETYYVSDTHG